MTNPKNKRWIVLHKGGDFQATAAKYHISPVIARLIRNRDIISPADITQYLYGDKNNLHDPFIMKDMKAAVDILQNKINHHAKIRVIGDYDIDGVNGTYILQQGLLALGAIVDTDIPDRTKDGYGLNQELVKRAHHDGIDTIITTDNGIAAHDEIAYGKSLGLTIIVTDHHEVPELVPPADAIINPHQQDCPYPFKGLCGAAIAYKLIEGMHRSANRELSQIENLIENVAIATIGDVMDLVEENRIFVKIGLGKSRNTQNVGLKTLIEQNSVALRQLNSYHIGFVIGPCINAGGRLSTAKKALELLNATTTDQAHQLAAQLIALNDERKELTVVGVDMAIEQIEHSDLIHDQVLVVYLPDCHESIAGIIAGRLRERYYRPVIVLTKGENNIKGSGRSIEEYHMYDGLLKCSSLLIRFGGHKLAAGMSLAEENIDLLRQQLNREAKLTQEDLTEKVSIDMPLPFRYISEQLITELSLLEPMGKGNRKPVFAQKEVTVRYPKIMGVKQNVLKFQAIDSDGTKIDAIYFGQVQDCYDYLQKNSTVSLTYYPQINEYMEKRTLQITVQDYA